MTDRRIGLTPDAQTIVGLYRLGVRVTDIARHFGVSKPRVSQAARRAGLPYHQKSGRTVEQGLALLAGVSVVVDESAAA